MEWWQWAIVGCAALFGWILVAQLGQLIESARYTNVLLERLTARMQPETDAPIPTQLESGRIMTN